jgi:hypothetical protein
MVVSGVCARMMCMLSRPGNDGTIKEKEIV